MKRGQAAWADIYQDNMFNDEPAEGTEYVVITVEAQFRGDPDQTKTVSKFDFQLVGERGVIYTHPTMTVIEPDINMELFGGGTGVGDVAFEVAEGEANLVLIYSGEGTRARYLSAEG